MGQVSSKLRRMADGYGHWCPGCLEVHKLPDSWQFNGNLENPTFSPSFRHTGLKITKNASGEWVEPFWERDAAGKTIPFVCHYILTAGQLHYCGDSNHSLAGKIVPLPDLPAHLRDDDF